MDEVCRESRTANDLQMATNEKNVKGSSLVRLIIRPSETLLQLERNPSYGRNLGRLSQPPDTFLI